MKLLTATVTVIVLSLIMSGFKTVEGLNDLQWRFLAGGLSTSNSHGTYGPVGTYGASYQPGSRYGSAMLTHNSDGITYVYGGNGFASTGTRGYLSDVWGYKINYANGTGTWAYLGGSSTTVDVPFGTTHPGGRIGVVSAFVDPSKPATAFYTFGGLVMDGATQMRTSDVWSFNTSTYSWKLESGSNEYSVYGVKGALSPLSHPGKRQFSTGIGGTNDMLFVFGGFGNDATGTGYLSDTWAFHTKYNMWMWFGGSNMRNQNSTLGPKWTFHNDYHPGGRDGATFIPGKESAYIHGGFGLSASTNNSVLGDLWNGKLNGSIGIWAFVSGYSALAGQSAPGFYGTMGQFSPLTLPGARYVHIGWADPNTKSDLIYLSAGLGYNGGASTKFLSDVFAFNYTSNQWAWIGGSSIPSNQSVVSTSSFSKDNMPAGRIFSSATTVYARAMVLVFGGGVSTTKTLNDLWATKSIVADVSLTCSAGFYLYSSSTSGAPPMCLPCTSGTWSSVVGATSVSTCQNCTAGEFSGSFGSTACTDCVAGKYQPLSGQTSCEVCTAGLWQSVVGSSSCLTCGVGTFSTSNGVSMCTSCSPGTYNNATQQTHCTDCSIGQFASSTAALECHDCPAGYYTNSTGTSKCSPCPQDHYSNVTAATSIDVCIHCAGGQFASPGATTCGTCGVGTYNHPTSGCTACPVGRYSLGGVTECFKCAAGSWASSTGSTSCVACGAGKYSTQVEATSDSVCQECPVGQYGTATVASKCAKCEAGKYSSLTGQSSSATCAQCTAGKWSSDVGASECVKCGAGKYSTSLGATSVSTCLGCIAGKFSSAAGSTTCDSCVAGKYTSTSGLSFCASCVPGKWQSDTAATHCNVCVAGKYSGSSAATHCDSCVAGKYTSTSGLSVCSSCTPGKWQNDTAATHCDLCAAGKYSGSYAATHCDSCVAGKFASTTGLSFCADCPAGQWQSATQSTGCVKCVAGKYSSTVGASASAVCTNCLKGWWSTVEGASTVSQCEQCIIGQYSSVAGSTQCTSCEAGKYGTTTGQSSCINCAAGQWSSDSGVSACQKCSAGKWSSAVGASASSVCTNCPAGKWSSRQGITTSDFCINCRIGRWSTVEGATGVATCAQCAAGQFESQLGSTGCDLCLPGQFSSVLGVTSCSSCSPGTWNNATADTDCDACPAGQFASSTAALQCHDCPAGYYTNSTGTSKCSPCPQDHYSNVTAATSIDVCIHCAGGQFASPGATTCGTCGVGTYDHPTSGCTACPVGRYSLGGVTECFKCAAGSWASSTGSTSCVACGAGKYSTQVEATSDSVCQECPAGEYSALEITSVCTKCEAGKYSSLTGQSSSATCTDCAAGKWSSTVGAASPTDCVGCPAGKWSTAVGAVADVVCQKCGVGSYSTVVGLGSSSCTPCAAGKYSGALGASVASACQVCDAGRWSSVSGATSVDTCTSCVAGTWSSLPGAPAEANCMGCVAGKWSTRVAATTIATCQSCAGGKWSSVIGASTSSTCLDCPAGEFSYAAAPSCTDCPAGKWSSIIASTYCTGCVGGKYSPALGASNVTTCDDCGIDTFSTGSAASCTACASGLHSLVGWDTCKPKDCFGVVGGTAVFDPCGVCNGTGSTCFGFQVLNTEDPLLPLSTTELGGSASFTVTLSKPPSDAGVSTVVVGIGFTDATEECCPSPSSLTFTESNWDQKQTVTIKGLPDGSNTDGDVESHVRVTGLAGSGWFTGQNSYRKVINKNVIYPEIMQFDPPRLPLSGMVVTVKGHYIQQGADFFFGPNRQQIPHDNVTWINENKAAILVPPAPLGYYPVYVANPAPLGGNASCPLSAQGGVAQQYGYSSCKPDSELYYDDNCPIVNTWGKGADCKNCPTYAICPGGHRIWPKPGYWSPNAQTEPIKCPVTASCTGGRNSECKVGYTGQFCAECSEAYYRDGAFCSPCVTGSDEAVLLLVVAGGFFLMLTIAVVVLSDTLLDISAALLVPIQQVANIGLIMGDSLSETIRSIFRILSLLSFELDFVKPGCSIGSISFSVVFGVSIGILAAVGLLFVFASFVRGFVFSKMKRGEFMAVFKSRIVRSLSILLSILYLSISARLFQGVYCVDVNRVPGAAAEYRLFAEMSKTCYVGDHLVVVIFAYLLIAAYIIGFPVFVLTKLIQHRSTLESKETRSKYGFLYRGLKTNIFWYRMIQFIVSATMSAERSFAFTDIERAAITAGVFIVALMVVLIFRPFKLWWRNLSEAGAGSLQVSLSLAVLINLQNSTAVLLFAILISVFGLEVLGSSIFFALKRKRAQKIGIADSGNKYKPDEENVELEETTTEKSKPKPRTESLLNEDEEVTEDIPTKRTFENTDAPAPTASASDSASPDAPLGQVQVQEPETTAWSRASRPGSYATLPLLNTGSSSGFKQKF